MLKEERQRIILDRISTYHKVLSTELSVALQVSEDTVRRDLKELADQGLIKKVHGGAVVLELNPFSFKDREVFALEKSDLVAHKALSLMHDGMVVIVDGGTSNMELIKALPKNLSVTILTNSLPIAVQLTEHPAVQIMVLGGRLLKNAQITVGTEVVQSLAHIRADLFLMGVRSLDVEVGVTEIDWDESHLKRAAVQNSAKVACLAISDKLNTVQPYKVCDIKEVNTLVTELEVHEPILSPYQYLGIEVI
ncbi:MAG: DeoR/GlpR transcriptional regulator [Cytophagales bacterium]|nr:DeoR/GlpR transcriptional regulator [Cytophagales bacterium]